MLPLFESEKDGVRLYHNRVELDRRGVLGTSTRTIYLHDIAEMRYSRGKSAILVTKMRTCVAIEFSKKLAAQQFVNALNSIMPEPELKSM